MAETEATEPIVDADVVEEPPTAPTAAVAVREQPTLTVAPQVEAAELGKRMDVIKAAMNDQMIAAVDYGVIPGTNKPTLLKPGAEKLGVLFQFDVQLDSHKEWGPGDHLTVETKATVYHAPTGQRLGFGEGLCTTREKKYGKRKLDRACPDCGEHALLRSKHEPEWFCWKKKGGCGNTFPLADPRITRQDVGEIENPDLPDTWNTVIKMAAKRARIDAILAATGASALFTQDVEDQQVPDNEPTPSTAPALPHGPKLDADTKEAAVKAAIELCNKDEDAARDLWGGLLERLGGYMPEAAAAALLAVKAMQFPVVPHYEDPTGDIPTEEQVAAEVAGLEDRALEVWQQLVSEKTAVKKVKDALGNVAVLRALIQKGEQALAKRPSNVDQEAVTA